MGPRTRTRATFRHATRRFGDALGRAGRILTGVSRPDARRALRYRFEEVCREMGVLFVVFAPIHFVLAAEAVRRVRLGRQERIERERENARKAEAAAR